MPAAWIGAGAAAIGAIGSLSGSSGGGASQVAQGVGNVVGGGLSANEAVAFGNQVAQTANPFGQYNQQFAGELAANANNFVGTNWGATKPVLDYAYGSTNPGGITSALNGSQIGGQINNLVNNPDSVYQTKQYQAAFGQGQNAVNATLAAQGLNGSGNQLAALQSYGQTFGQQAYGAQLSQLSGLYGQALGANQQGFNQMQAAGQMALGSNQQGFNQLSQLSGLATGSPTAAAAAQAQIYGNVNSAGQTIGQGIGQIGSGVGNLLNGLNFGSGTTGFSSGQGTSTSGFGDVSGSGGLFGTSAGTNNTGGFTMGGGGNSWGFTE